MLGVLYLILCFAVGAVVCALCFPKLCRITESTFSGKQIALPAVLVALPVWYFTGTMIMSWATYFLGYVFKNNTEPLRNANIIVMLSAVVSLAVFIVFKLYKRYNDLLKGMKTVTVLYLFAALVLVSMLMFRTFYVSGDKLCVGLSVFSDFSPHLGMIRSFSYGNNFPTQYAHFAGEDIKYHFMFQFLVGNLEYLGLRIDYAFNIPSIFNMMGVYSLLYVLTVKITGKRTAGVVAGFLFTFRSSPSVFKYIAGIADSGNIRNVLSNNIEFIGETVNESWGLWNLNVYCNQRHFAFSLAIMVFAVIVFLEHYYKQRERFRIACEANEKSVQGQKTGNAARVVKNAKTDIKMWLFTKEGWKIESLKRALFMGAVLGMSTFFNGAVLICTLAVMFVMAAASDNRLEILISAVMATAMSFLQSGFFIEGSAVSPKYQFGFIAPVKTFAGVWEYIFELTGVVPFVIAAALVVLKKSEKYLVAAFAAPFLLAFTLSLTPDVTVNHKNIMLSLLLLGVFMADVIVKFYESRGVFAKFFACMLLIVMTLTGIYDFEVVIRRNSDNYNLKYDMNDELMLWIKENTDSSDIFLTNNYYLNNMVLGGAMLYDGWQYYAWSAGYDTGYRDGMVAAMYSAPDKETLYGLAEAENIRYIVVDNANRTSSAYVLNEALIDSAYEKVYESGDGAWMVSVYDTTLKK